MAAEPNRSTIYRFGLYEAHMASGELFRQGRRVKLQEQPLRLLVALLENPGEVVTRELLSQRLWPQGTFVDFDQGLATAVTKLRQALSDNADNPRFVETVPKRGYRFLAAVTVVDQSRGPIQNQVPSSPLPQISMPAGQQTADDQPVPTQLAPNQTGEAQPASSRMVRNAFAAASVAVLAVVLAIYFYSTRHEFLVTAKDTVLVADFVNTTGEPVFDDTLRQALEIDLEQSPVIQVLSDRKIETILKEMGRSGDDRVSGRIAVEACQRASSKVAVQGSIASLGNAYLVDLAAIRCDNGEPIVLEQMQARRKEDVVKALGNATARLRKRLGESVPSIKKYDVPLEQATTSSLEALKSYSLGLSIWNVKGDQASIPFFQNALHIDPSFAMAYDALGTVYHNLSQTELARVNATRAYELKERVTEAERIAIASRYFLYVTGDLEQAAHTYESAVQSYPNSAGALNHLGTTNGELGRYVAATENLRLALDLDPTRATTYANLATDLLALNRINEAGFVLDEASRLKMETDYLLQVNYWRAFLRGDSAMRLQILERSRNVPRAHSLLLFEEANTEAYYGRFAQARQLWQEAANLMKSEGDGEAAADCLAMAAAREAEIGEVGRARQLSKKALQSTQDQNVMVLAALAQATIGESEQAASLAEKLDQLNPSNTVIQKYWLPTIRARVDLNRGKTQANDAIRSLEVAAPYETAGMSGLSVSTLYPAYVRGQAYLARADGSLALAEFQKLIDNPGLVLNMPQGALARLGRARAYALSDREKAQIAYRDFFQLWKDADPDIPILQQAHREFSRLAR